MQIRLKTFMQVQENIYASTIENIYARSENIYASSENIYASSENIYASIIENIYVSSENINPVNLFPHDPDV